MKADKKKNTEPLSTYAYTRRYANGWTNLSDLKVQTSSQHTQIVTSIVLQPLDSTALCMP